MTLSVIIPAYNTASLLDCCLSSIEPMSGLEVVVVDDGSTDGTVGLVSAKMESRNDLRLISQANGGVSRARNAGLDAVSGTYVAFVDADDVLLEGALPRCMVAVRIASADILVMRSFCGEAERYVWKGRFREGISYFKEDFLRAGFLRGSVCGCVFRTGFLREHALLFPPDVSMAEDTVFWAAVLAEGAAVQFVDIPFYSITARPESSSRRLDDGFIYRYGKSLIAARQRITDRAVGDSVSLGIVMGIVNAAVKMGWSPQRTYQESGIGSVLPFTTRGIYHQRGLIRILNWKFSLFFRIKQLRDLFK